MKPSFFLLRDRENYVLWQLGDQARDKVFQQQLFPSYPLFNTACKDKMESKIFTGSAPEKEE